MNRRDFLSSAAKAVAVAAVAANPLAAKANEFFKGNPERLGVLVDTPLCIGLNCRRCEIACAKEQGLPPIEKPPEDESVFREIRRTRHDQFTVVNRFPNPDDPNGQPIYVKKQCMHCDEPACASACLVKAFSKTPEGPVIYNASVCIGCRYCMTACPFNVPAYEYHEPLHPRVRKCTLCYATKTSKREAPACVSACPKEAMIFGRRRDLIKLAHEKIAANPSLYADYVYGEREAGGTSWLYLAGVPFDSIDMSTDLGVKPYPELTRGFLSAVPLVLVLWPVLFTGIYKFSRRRDQISSSTDNESTCREDKP